METWIMFNILLKAVKTVLAHVSRWSHKALDTLFHGQHTLTDLVDQLTLWNKGSWPYEEISIWGERFLLISRITCVKITYTCLHILQSASLNIVVGSNDTAMFKSSSLVCLYSFPHHKIHFSENWTCTMTVNILLEL